MTSWIVSIETKRPDVLALVSSIAPQDATGPEDAPLVLAVRDDGLELRDRTMRPGKGVRIDFAAVARAGRGRSSLSKRQPLARAIGRESRIVIDVTAGLGGDAALLAAMGYEVTAIERHPVLAAMLQDGVQRASQEPSVARLLGGRLRIVVADASTWLNRCADTIDCVYLDPMFPPKRRESALAGKDIRLVRELVGEDEDAATLLAAARRSARRVAVKRPRHAAPLAQDVTARIDGTLVRYDLYIRAT